MTRSRQTRVKMNSDMPLTMRTWLAQLVDGGDLEPYPESPPLQRDDLDGLAAWVEWYLIARQIGVAFDAVPLMSGTPVDAGAEELNVQTKDFVRWLLDHPLEAAMSRSGLVLAFAVGGYASSAAELARRLHASEAFYVRKGRQDAAAKGRTRVRDGPERLAVAAKLMEVFAENAKRKTQRSPTHLANQVAKLGVPYVDRLGVNCRSALTPEQVNRIADRLKAEGRLTFTRKSRPSAGRKSVP